MDCIFCSIIEKKAPAEIIYEDESSIVIKNIRPLAPIHLLVIPRKHIPSVNDIREADKDLVGGLFLSAQKATEKINIKEIGYKLAVNVGKGGGQEIDHLHIHLLGGWQS